MNRSALIRSLRSELHRLLRPTTLSIGLGLTATFAAITAFVVLSNVDDGQAGPTTGPDVGRTLAEIEQPGGFLESLDLLSDFVGLVALAVWAIAVASDYNSGLIRLLVQAQPSRATLMAGKIAALAGFTAAITAVAVAVTTLFSFAFADTAGVDTGMWTESLLSHMLSSYVNLTVATVTWGALGLLIATLTRSSGIAIGVGVGWILVVELIVSGMATDVADYLPGGTIGAVAAGGTPGLAWLTALTLVLVYLLSAIAVSTITFVRRDIVA